MLCSLILGNCCNFLKWKFNFTFVKPTGRGWSTKEVKEETLDIVECFSPPLTSWVVDALYSHKACYNKPIRILVRMVDSCKNGQWNLAKLKLIKHTQIFYTLQVENKLLKALVLNEWQLNSQEHKYCSGWQHYCDWCGLPLSALERISAVGQLYLYTLIERALSTNGSTCYIQTLL